MSISALRSARWIFSVMAVTVFSALVLVGCAKDDDDGGNSLVGEWVLEEEPSFVAMKFTDKKMFMNNGDNEIGDVFDEFSYTVSGDKIRCVSEYEDFLLPYSIKDGKLTLIFQNSDGDNTVVLVRKK
jgi:hypothetical protein